MDIANEDLTPEENEEFLSECKIKAYEIINRLTEGKAKEIISNGDDKAEEIKRAHDFQYQFMYYHPELLEDDCYPVSMLAMNILSNAGVLEVVR